jgi:hypothetical protein
MTTQFAAKRIANLEDDLDLTRDRHAQLMRGTSGCQSGWAAPIIASYVVASRLHVRCLLKSITRDLCHPDYHDNRGSKAEAQESPVLPAIFRRLATGG